eukprot:446790-Pyramimonas_sp.AAC.1
MQAEVAERGARGVAGASGPEKMQDMVHPPGWRGGAGQGKPTSAQGVCWSQADGDDLLGRLELAAGR